jgi:hypothetical protein
MPVTAGIGGSCQWHANGRGYAGVLCASPPVSGEVRRWHTETRGSGGWARMGRRIVRVTVGCRRSGEDVVEHVPGTVSYQI